MTTTDKLKKAQAICDRAELTRLDTVVALLLTAVGREIPDFDALAGEAVASSVRDEAAAGGEVGDRGADRRGPGVPPAGLKGLRGVSVKGIPGVNPLAAADPAAAARVEFVAEVKDAKVPLGTWAEIARSLGKTDYAARRFTLKALKARILLPRLYARVVAADGAGFERLDIAAGRAFEIDPAMYDFFDRCLEGVDERAGMQSFKATVNAAVALLKTPSHESERAHQDRCVRSYNLGDGRSVVEMTGPTLEVEAFMKRLEAFARNIRISLSGLLDTAETLDGKSLAEAGIDPAAIELADERNMAQLMFDMMAAYAPTLGIHVRSIGCDPDQDGRGGTDQDGRGGNAAGGAAAGGTSILVHMPTRDSWLRSQAQVSVLVPVMTALGLSNLPGSLAGVEPIPAEAAQRLAAGLPSLRRLLCDPATGQVLPEQATSYPTSQAMRKTLEAKHPWCAMPGCSRPAERCETEHIIPFDHESPSAGGQSDFGNLQLMCRSHHQLKTAGQISVQRNADGSLRYAWTSPTAPTGFTTDVAEHRHVLGRIAARELVDHLTVLSNEARTAGLRGASERGSAEEPHSERHADPATASASDPGDTAATGRPGTSVPGSQGTGVPSDPGASAPQPAGPSEPDCDESPLSPLQKNWDRLDRIDRELPPILGLRDMLATGGLLPALPPLKLNQAQELEVLYRVAQAQHRQAYHGGPLTGGGTSGCMSGNAHGRAVASAVRGPVDACPEHAMSTDPDERAACLGVSNEVPPHLLCADPGAVEREGDAAGDRAGSSSGRPTPGGSTPAEPGSPVKPRLTAEACPYASPCAPYRWEPAGFVEWARHRTLAEILADPWRHDDPIRTRDLAEAQASGEAEDEADLPPF